MPIIVAVLFGVAALAHAAPFPFLLEAFRPARSLWHMASTPESPSALYLTFDDGPNPDWTPPLLDALKETGIHATFFLIDDHITPETEPIVKRIAAEGHAIALHSGRRWLMLMSPDALAAQLRTAAGRIEALTGSEPCHLFRPHGGWRSATMYEGLDKAGFTLTGWSWGMWDWDWWRQRRPERLAGRLARKASAGDIIVIHDGHHKNPRADRRHAAGTVRLLVPQLKSRGFVFGTLCDPVSAMEPQVTELTFPAVQPATRREPDLAPVAALMENSKTEIGLQARNRARLFLGTLARFECSRRA